VIELNHVCECGHNGYSHIEPEGCMDEKCACKGFKEMTEPTLEEMMIRDATTKPAPDSEDEAFERWFVFESVYVETTRTKQIARSAWHARARLSAGGK